jgi:hypothetical protein
LLAEKRRFLGVNGQNEEKHDKNILANGPYTQAVRSWQQKAARLR